MTRILIALLMLGCTAFAQRQTTMPPTRSSMVATTAWLAARLGQPDIAILHVGHDRRQYDQAHIPGARFLSVSDILVTRNDVPNEVAPVEQLKRAFESLGAGDGVRIILYGDESNLFAARAWFTLAYLGHADHAALLDGGLEKWRSEKHPVTTEVASARPAVLTPHIRPEILVTLPEVADLSWQATHDASSGVNLVDARPPAQFSGAEAGDAITRAGHIPGSVNLYWKDTLESPDNPQLLAIPDLRKIFHDAGISGSRVVVYCRSGMQAAHLFFTATFLGYDPVLYDGSFLEWSNSSSNPVEKGSRPKAAAEHVQ